MNEYMTVKTAGRVCWVRQWRCKELMAWDRGSVRYCATLQYAGIHTSHLDEDAMDSSRQEQSCKRLFVVRMTSHLADLSSSFTRVRVVDGETSSVKYDRHLSEPKASRNKGENQIRQILSAAFGMHSARKVAHTDFGL